MKSKHILKPHDIVIPLKFIALAGVHKTYRELSEDIYISIGEISEGVQRLKYSKIISKKGSSFRISRKALFDFILHGIPYVFPAKKGAKKKGIKTSYSAYPLNKDIVENNEIIVWGHKEGNVIGYAIDPLYEKAPLAAKKDERLYILLSLIDAIRLGNGRSYKIAKRYLEEIIIENNWKLKSEYE